MKDKTVIITGGSSGIGLACAKRFAQSGAKIIIASRNQGKLDAAMIELRKIHSDVHAVAADVSRQDDCKLIINEAINRFGGIDVLINNAGISMRGLFEETSLDVIKKVMDINFWGTIYCTKLALPYLLKSQGSVVGISSIGGKKGLPGRAAYSSSKFAMEGFLETLRTENLKKKLHVLVACPGFTSSGIRNAALGPDGMPQKESPINEAGLMQASEVANHIYTAVVHRKRDLVLTFYGKLTVWLNKFIPSMMDKIVFNHFSKEPGSPFN